MLFDIFMYIACVSLFIMMWAAPIIGAMRASNKVESNEQMLARWARDE